MSSPVTPYLVLLGLSLGLAACVNPGDELAGPLPPAPPLMTPEEAVAAKVRENEAVSIDRFILLASAWQLEQRCHVLKAQEKQDFERNLAQATQTMSAVASPAKAQQLRVIGQTRAERYACDGDGRDLIHNAARKSSEALPIEASPNVPPSGKPS